MIAFRPTLSTLLVSSLLYFMSGTTRRATAFSVSRPQQQQQRGHCGSLSATNKYDEHDNTSFSRRDVLRNTLLASAAAVGLSSPSNAAGDSPTEDTIDVYFGCGCFWHVQHEFVEAERRILGRTNPTARAGYAGGNAGADDSGRVCYHNALRVADYGSFGHAEVVALRDVPVSKFAAFCEEYFRLFDDKGNRPDQSGDRGLEYRNLVGVPGGSASPYAATLVEASKRTGDKLDFARGKGDDPDARATAFVMDSTKYPFYVAEQYHQFHDGFNYGENYPNSYNSLAFSLAKENNLGLSACPNGLLGLGALGL